MSTSVPVLVGIAQLEQRVSDPKTGKEPLALMIDAVRAAAQDAGSDALLAAATSVRVIRGVWPYKNPARVVASAVGTPNALDFPPGDRADALMADKSRCPPTKCYCPNQVEGAELRDLDHERALCLRTTV